MTARSDLRESARFMDDLERRLAPLDRTILRIEWRRTVGRDGDDEAVQARRYHLLGAPALLDRIRRYRSMDLPRRLARRLELLERAALQSRIEEDPEIVRHRARLQTRIARFRPRWAGHRVGRAVVRREARTNPDRAVRERAYRAEDRLYRPMENDLRELAKLRNERARAFGFGSYAEYRLRLEGLTVARFRGLVEDALRYIPTEMRRRRDVFQDRTGERGWYPWDVAYTQELETGATDALFPGDRLLPEALGGIRRWGFRSDTLRFRVDRHDLSSGGMCLAPDPPRDVRIVVHPAGGFPYARALFHEVGHAVSSRSVRQPTHLLRWHEHLPGFAGLAEGEGAFFEQIPESEAWLRERIRAERPTVDRLAQGARRFPLGSMAFLASWVLRELSLYDEPIPDLAATGLRWERRIFGFDAYEPNSYADSFALQIPVYSASYVMAQLLRPALTRAALDEVGGDLWPNPRIGPWLTRRWLRDGSSYDWWTRLNEITGRPFGAGPFNAWARATVGS